MWPGTAGVSWCVNLYVGQEVGPARGNKKNLIRFCPVGARCGACPLKKLRLDYEAEVSPKGDPEVIVFLPNVGVKDNRMIPVSFRTPLPDQRSSRTASFRLSDSSGVG